MKIVRNKKQQKKRNEEAHRKREEKFSSKLSIFWSGMNIFCTHTQLLSLKNERTRRICCLLVRFSLVDSHDDDDVQNSSSFFFLLFLLSLSLSRYVTHWEKEKRQALFWRTTRRACWWHGQDWTAQWFFFFPLLYKKNSSFFSSSSSSSFSGFSPSFTQTILFTIACIMLLCAYFQGSLLLHFCLTRRWEKTGMEIRRRRRRRRKNWGVV